ncbi:hypothetical protein CB255_18715, partial [Salmonella enterica subsp. enterica serovar Agona]|nr:hypothetical protein [Salmonella enterica subsp. enterica serovar Agona]
MPAAADVVGKVTAGVQFQRGVVGDVASPQRLNVAGDQRAVADERAAAVAVGAGKREHLVAGFDHLTAAADGVVERAAGVQLQSGVVSDVASTQRLNVAGDQRAAADKGAAGISIAAGKRERVVAGFFHFAATADGVVKIADSVQRQRGVVGNVASTQRVHVVGDQRAAADKGAAGISIAAGERERVVAGFLHAARTADVVGKVTACVQHQRGVVGNVASTQRVYIVGDQRAAADKGAAGISIAAGKRELVIAGFFHTARTADVIDEVTAGVQLQRGVVGDVAGTQRLNVAGDQRAVADERAA